MTDHGTGLRVTELHARERDAAAAIWHDLETRHGDRHLTTSWIWTSAWLETFGDLVPHLFLVVENQHQPVAITLLTRGVGQTRGPIPVRSIHLGTGGEPVHSAIATEYRRLLADPAHHAAAAAAIVHHIDRASPFAWEELLLDAMPAEEARPFTDRPGFWYIHQEPSRYTDLDAIRASGGDVIAALGKNTRYAIRRSLRKYGDVTVTMPASVSDAGEILDEMIDLHQQSWIARGHPGVFADDRFTAFHRRLIPALLQENALLLARVHTAGETIGGIYGFHDQGRVLMYQSGFRTTAESSLKPGLVSHALVMQRLLEQGFKAYDYLVGDARYKQELSTSSTRLVYAVRSRRTIKQALLYRARLRHYGPHTPIDGESGS